MSFNSFLQIVNELECNEYARRFNIHQSDDSFRDFLTKVKLQSEKRNSRLNSTRTTANSICFITLKEYLIQRYCQVLTNKQSSQNQIGEEFIGYYEKEKQVIKIKMKIGLLYQEEPFLIITFNDRIDEDNINCLKKEINNVKSLFMLATTSNKIKSMEINNCLSQNNIQLAKQTALQQYISIASIEEFIKQIVQKDFVQQLTYNKINMKSIIELIRNIYPLLKIEIDSATLNSIIINDLQKVKITLFYLLNLIQDQVSKETSSPQQKRSSLALIRQSSFSNIQLKAQSNRDRNKQTTLTIAAKQSFLYDSIHFRIKESISQSENFEETSSEKSLNTNQSGFTEEQIVKEIQKESIRYYISQIGPNNNLPQKIQLENDSAYVYEFEIFQDIKNLANKKSLTETQRYQDVKKERNGSSTFKKEQFVKEKNVSYYSSEQVIFNQNIRYNKQIIINNPIFIEYCQRLNKSDYKPKIKQEKKFSLNYIDQSPNVPSINIITERDKEETTSLNFQNQYTMESNTNLPYINTLETNKNELALKLNRQ